MTSASPSPAPSPADRTTVLVVDDEDGIRQALTRFLTRLGYQVSTAANATEALQRLPADHPQAMLCDIRMPEITGVQLLPKALAQDPDLAVIMLTAIDEPRTAIECLKLGAYDYLIKPVDLEELELSLQHALRQRQLEVDRRQLEQWLAREVAVRTRDLEERTAAIEEIALDALAAAREWAGTDAAISKLAEELGAPREELALELKRRREER
jgi:DNA-binding NtrC family response regulator